MTPEKEREVPLQEPERLESLADRLKSRLKPELRAEVEALAARYDAAREDMQIAEAALVGRYINHKLSEEEETEFELRMIADSQLLEQVQIAKALKAAFRANMSHTETQITDKDKPRNLFSRANKYFLSPVSGWTVLQALLIALIVIAIKNLS